MYACVYVENEFALYLQRDSIFHRAEDSCLPRPEILSQ